MLVGKDAVPIATSGQEVVIKNVAGDTLFYADNAGVSSTSNQGTLTVGQTLGTPRQVWLRSATFTTVTLASLAFPSRTLPAGPVVTPEDFGAVGDGVIVAGSGTGGSLSGTDDTNALKGALAALSPVGGTLLLGPKTYFVNGAPDNTFFGNAVLPVPTMGISKAQLNAQGANIPFDKPSIRVIGTPGLSKIICPRNDAYSAQNGPMSIIGSPTVEGLGLTKLPPAVPLRFELEGVTIVGPDQPVGLAVDKCCFTSSRSFNCSIFTTTTLGFQTAGSSPTVLPGIASAGIRAPISAGMESRNMIQECTINGYGTLVVAGNHTVITDLIGNFCRTVIGVDDTMGANSPSATIHYCLVSGAKQYVTGWDPANGVKALTTTTNSNPRTVTGTINVVAWISPFDPTTAFLDTNNLLAGDLKTYNWPNAVAYSNAPVATGRTAALNSRPLDQTGVIGSATMTAGSTGAITTGAAANIVAASQIRHGIKTPGGTVGAHFVNARGTGSVTINSTSGTDTSTVWYEVANPGP